MTTSLTRPLRRVLLVEDNPSDVRLTREAMREGDMQAELAVVGDGEQALDYLFQRAPFVAAPRPDLVLLDLNLPGCDGREVLKVLKQRRGLLRIPVVVLSTSVQAKDIHDSYDLHANSYIAKPADLDGFIDVVRQIEAFWFQVVTLPERDAN